MPDSGNPGVSVFHFTSRISNAKIKKYKQATERGMSVGKKDVSTASESITPVPNQSFDSGEPVTKKQKITSHSTGADLPVPAAFDEPLATSRSKRGSTFKFRYSDNMVISAEDRATAAWESTSELSSLPHTPQIEPDSAIDREPTPPSIDEDYGMLSTYYIMDDDGDDVNKKTSEPSLPRSPTTSTAPIPTSASRAPEQPEETPQPVHPLGTQCQPHPKKKQSTRHRTKAQVSSNLDNRAPPVRPPQPQAGLQHPPPPPMIPRVVLMNLNLDCDPQKRREGVAVEEMIKNIDILSVALSVFSRVPFVPGPTGPPQATTLKFAESAKSQANKNGAVDDFLSMIDSVSDNEQDDEESFPTLSHPGQPDESLVYGIQFIQNALRSWAFQRLQSMIADHTMDQWYEQQVQQSSGRGPGRPRKSDYGIQQQDFSPTVHINLEIQPEGRAILAFHQVLRCGALQVNGVLPPEMARALTQLYMQIDHLINNGHKSDTPFVCMSYGAQQAAHRSRLQKAQEDIAKMQEEFELFHKNDVHHSTLSQQMSTAPVQQYPGSPDRSHQAGHSPAYPILLGSQPASTQLDSAPVHIPNDRPVRHAQVTQNVQARYRHRGSSQEQPIQQAVDPKGGLLSRSGQQMRFSFSPGNEQAVRLSGHETLSGTQPKPKHFEEGPKEPVPLTARISKTASRLPSSTAITATTDHASGVATVSQDVGPEDLTNDANRKAHTTNSIIEISSDVEPPTDHDNIVVAPAPKSTGFTAINTVPRPSPSTRSEASITRIRKDLPESRLSTAMRGARQVGSAPSVAKHPHSSAIVVDP